jgi:hypothetical protein
MENVRWDDYTDSMISDFLKTSPNYITQVPTERLNDKMIEDVFYTCDIDTVRWIYVYNLTFDKHIFSDQYFRDYINYLRHQEFCYSRGGFN